MRISRLILAIVASIVVLTGMYVFVTRSTQEPRITTTSAVASKQRTVAVKPAESATAAPAMPSGEAARTVQAPAAALARITALKISANDPQSVRRLLVELQRLQDLGPAALPVLREFLTSGQDADYNSAFSKFGFKDGKVPLDFAVPPSLRLALLEVVKNIGGGEAEALLARELKTTGRGIEAAYVAGALLQLAPEKYRETSAAAARDLLAMPLSVATKNPLDRSDREYLYNILVTAGDASQVAQAQAQLVQPGGQLDRGALHYLQQALGPAAVDVALTAWNDPRVPANQREPLARVALTFVGVDDRADRFYQTAIADPNLSPGQRKNLIEDLNQDGFTNPKKLTSADLMLIERRLALIERLAPGAKDPVSVAAFAEAKKDLLAMRDKVPLPGAPKK
jgi:hypothetical protein